MSNQVDCSGSAHAAATLFDNGFHCAEAVARSVLEALGRSSSEATAHATAFGGGFGRTFEEACGALSGGLIAIGHLYGRRQAGENWDLPARLAAALRSRFLDDFGSTHCASLRQRFGPERQHSECRDIVGATTACLLGLLQENPAGIPPEDPGTPQAQLVKSIAP